MHSLYQAYGQGKLPPTLTAANSKIAAETELLNAYLVIRGRADVSATQAFFRELGYRSDYVRKSSLYQQWLTLIPSPIYIISLGFLWLTFLGLTFIAMSKHLKDAGVARLQGYTWWRIWLLALNQSIKDFLILSGLALLGSLICLAILPRFDSLCFNVLMSAILLHLVICLGISLLGSSLLSFLAKDNQLLNLLKGKLPLRSLTTLMLLGQILALVLSIGVIRTGQRQWQDYHELQAAKADWQKMSDYYIPVYGFGAGLAKNDDLEKQDSAWFQVLKTTLEQDEALFVSTNFSLQTDDTGKEEGVEDYSLYGQKSMMVSPSYLKQMKLPLSKDFMAKMTQLKQGEFGLILPSILAGQTEKYRNRFQQELLQATSLAETRIYTTSINDTSPLFVMNHLEYTSKQYLTDPILLVVSPHSTPETTSSRMFWAGMVSSSIYFKDYTKSIALLRQMNALESLSALKNAKQTYQLRLAEAREALVMMLLSSSMGFITAFLLFNAVTLLYFNQYAKDLLLAKIFGHSFWERHGHFLLLQVSCLSISIALAVYLFGGGRVNLTIACLAMGNAFLLMWLQDKRQSKEALALLKGK